VFPVKIYKNCPLNQTFRYLKSCFPRSWTVCINYIRPNVIFKATKREYYFFTFDFKCSQWRLLQKRLYDVGFLVWLFAFLISKELLAIAVYIFFSLLPFALCVACPTVCGFWLRNFTMSIWSDIYIVYGRYFIFCRYLSYNEITSILLFFYIWL
jgi:hypothetical protein